MRRTAIRLANKAERREARATAAARCPGGVVSCRNNPAHASSRRITVLSESWATAPAHRSPGPRTSDTPSGARVPRSLLLAADGETLVHRPAVASRGDRRLAELHVGRPKAWREPPERPGSGFGGLPVADGPAERAAPPTDIDSTLRLFLRGSFIGRQRQRHMAPNSTGTCFSQYKLLASRSRQFEDRHVVIRASAPVSAPRSAAFHDTSSMSDMPFT